MFGVPAVTIPHPTDILDGMPTLTNYPKSGTHAERILDFISKNEGTTKNAIITGLDLNPGIVRKCIIALMAAELLVDTPDGNGHHHYTAKVK